MHQPLSAGSLLQVVNSGDIWPLHSTQQVCEASPATWHDVRTLRKPATRTRVPLAFCAACSCWSGAGRWSAGNSRLCTSAELASSYTCTPVPSMARQEDVGRRERIGAGGKGQRAVGGLPGRVDHDAHLILHRHVRVSLGQWMSSPGDFRGTVGHPCQRTYYAEFLCKTLLILDCHHALCMSFRAMGHTMSSTACLNPGKL